MRTNYEALAPVLNERARRLWAAAEAEAVDRGGIAMFARLWKWELQRFAKRTGLSIAVCHYPPGISKWNRIEHRLMSYIAMDWRGKPLVSLTTVVNLTGATTTRSCLRVRSEIDTRSYPQGVKVTDEQTQRINLSWHEYHGDWNYTIEAISVS